MSRKKLQHVLIGAAFALLLIVPAAVLAFVESGLFNVGATSPHTRFTTWITHETMIHSVRRNVRTVALPPEVTSQRVVAGFCAYETHCVACHGASGVARRTWVAGMEPAPPYLLDVQQRFTPMQLFWIVKNGIKMTGMPAWRASMSDNDIWNVVAWLEVSAKLPPQTYRRWRSERRCPVNSGSLLALAG